MLNAAVMSYEYVSVFVCLSVRRPGKGSSSPRVEYGEPGLDLRPEEAISTSTRTLLASPGGGGPWDGHGVAAGGPLPLLRVRFGN